MVSQFETSVFAKEWFEPYPLELIEQIGKDSSIDIPDVPPKNKPIGIPALDVAVGPVLRLLASLEENLNNYRGSILLVINEAQNSQFPVVKYAIGPAISVFSDAGSTIIDTQEVSVMNGEFPGEMIHKEKDFAFYRFTIDLLLTNVEQVVKYSINGESKPYFSFFIPSVDQTMNILSFSCNGFSLNADTFKYKNSLWYDLLRNHATLHHYHVAIGGGDQLYSDKVKLVSEEFKESLKHKHFFNDALDEQLENFYLSNYTSWFGQGHWIGPNGKTLQALFPIALASIPFVNIYDDHDIIDGYGTYKDSTMSSPLFKGLGETAFKYYLLFQHHTSPFEKNQSLEKSWIFGAQRGPFINEYARSLYIRLGKSVAFLGMDCRTERKNNQVVLEKSYDLMFHRLQKELELESGKQIKHLLVLLGVPIAYPRLVWLEKLLKSPILAPARMMAEQGLINRGLVNEFDGAIEVVDDLEDHWCAANHKHERNRLVGRLQYFGAKNKIRITILSGDVHLGAIGRFKSRIHKHSIISKHIKSNEEILQSPEKDPRLMLNIVSSAITNVPPPNGMATLLYKRGGKIHRFDHSTDEDMVDIFRKDVNGTHRNNRMFNNRRNYASLIMSRSLPRYKDIEDGTIKFPGLISDGDATTDNKDLYGKVGENTLKKVGYPLLSDSLSAFLHMERSAEEVNSECSMYEIVIPPLVEGQELEFIGEK